MFGNLVNRHDVGRLLTLLKRSGRRSIVDRLRGTQQERVKKAWNHPVDSADQWWAV